MDTFFINPKLCEFVLLAITNYDTEQVRSNKDASKCPREGQRWKGSERDNLVWCSHVAGYLLFFFSLFFYELRKQFIISPVEKWHVCMYVCMYVSVCPSILHLKRCCFFSIASG